MYLQPKKFNDSVIKDNSELPIKGNIFLSGHTPKSYAEQMAYKQELDKISKLVGLKFGGWVDNQYTGELPKLQTEEQIEILASYAVPELVKIAKSNPVPPEDLKDSERLEII